jgi:hypothetical protein
VAFWSIFRIVRISDIPQNSALVDAIHSRGWQIAAPGGAIDRPGYHHQVLLRSRHTSISGIQHPCYRGITSPLMIYPPRSLGLTS